MFRTFTAGDSMAPGAVPGLPLRSKRGHRLGRVTLAGVLAVGVTLAVAAVGPAAAAAQPSVSQPPAAVPAATATAIQVHYGQLGGAGGFLGAQTTGETGLPDGAYAGYRNGVIYYSPATGAWEVHGAVLGTWSSLGAQNSPVGYPVTDERGTPDGVGRYNLFARGSIYWSPGSGAHEVRGGIGAAWSRLGSQAGFLGYPVTNELAAADGVGRYNVFQGGSVYYSPATGANEVHAGIRAKWAALGAETGTLGYPTRNESTARDGVGRYNTFQRGVAYWSPGTGTQEVHGAILAKWAATGAETGVLGYPTSDEYAVPGGRRNNFQNGTITWDATTGATTASTSPTPAPIGPAGSWALGFADEFNGTAVDWTKWADHSSAEADQGHGNPGNQQLEWNQAANCSVANGVLNMTAKREVHGSYNWTSCLITSAPSFSFQYGYMEERAQLPSAKGFWPAFWTWSTGNTYIETDAYEFYSDNHAMLHLTQHSGSGGKCNIPPGFDPTTGMHTYGVDIEPSGTTWYLDGRVACSTSATSPGKTALISDNFVYSVIPPDAATTSATKQIDYIRAWTRGP